MAQRELPADRAAIVRVLLGLSQLTIDFPCIRAVDINPLLADAEGVIALDARIEIDPEGVAERGPNPSLSIRPYPSGWEKIAIAGALQFVLRQFVLRPIRPEDAALYPTFLERMEWEDLRLRFLSSTTTIAPDMLIRLTQLDYDRDIAFIALEQRSGSLAGIVRYAADPDREAAEFGVLVRSDLKGQGLGRILMQHLIEYARSEGLARLDGFVLRENTRMLSLCRQLGFALSEVPSDAALASARLVLAA